MTTNPPIGSDVPFLQHLGVEVVHQEQGRVIMALQIKPEYTNSWHVAHGGVTMTLLDVAMGGALRTTDPERGSAVSIEIKVNFLAPGNGRLSAEGRVLQRGSSISVCEGEIRDESGALVAKALGTYMLKRRKEQEGSR